MGDLKSVKAIIAKGGLFLFLGLMASALIVLQSLDLKVIALHVLAVWAFCRFYYFAFYVIQHYVDSQFRFAGLLDFGAYLMKRRGRTQGSDTQKN